MSDSTLGVILLAMAEGSVLSLPVAGGLVGRFGSRPMTALAGLALCLALPLPVVSGSGLTLALSLALLGAANGTLDLSMNAQALSLERRYQRPIMSSIHACFSLGGAAGAALAGILMWLGVGDTAHVSFAAAVGAGAVITVWGFLLPAEPRGERPAGGFGWPAPALLFMGALAFVGLLAEGAMADWSAVYLHDSLKASPALAAAGFAAFSLAMTAGRLAGDRVVGRLGAVQALRASGGLAAAGLAAGLLVSGPTAAIAGFGLLGAGIANVIPVLFSSAGNAAGSGAASALAAVATPGYLGFLAGPSLTGSPPSTSAFAPR